MTPEHIYKQVMTKTGVTPCSLCQLHVPCRHIPSCLSLQQTPVINLDEVEHNGTVRRDVLLLLRLMLFRIRKRYCALLN